MAQKKSRQTFEKLKREQAVKEKRALKQDGRYYDDVLMVNFLDDGSN